MIVRTIHKKGEETMANRKRRNVGSAQIYRAGFSAFGSGASSYSFWIDFDAWNDSHAIDTVDAILNGQGMILPPPGMQFELHKLLDEAGKVVLT